MNMSLAKRLLRTNTKSHGVDEIMEHYRIGRYRAREIWIIMHEHNVDMETAHRIYTSSREVLDAYTD